MEAQSKAESLGPTDAVPARGETPIFRPGQLVRVLERFDGGFWRFVHMLGMNVNTLGFVIIGVFVSAWAASVGLCRFNRLDHRQGAATIVGAGEPASSGRA